MLTICWIVSLHIFNLFHPFHSQSQCQDSALSEILSLHVPLAPQWSLALCTSGMTVWPHIIPP